MSKVRQQEPEGFIDFWDIWRPIARHTDGRGLARDAFRKLLLCGVLPADMIDGARWYARNLSEREKPYVPLSTTWLNRETFADLCEKERTFQVSLAQPKESTVVPIRAVLPANHFLNQYKQGNA